MFYYIVQRLRDISGKLITAFATNLKLRMQVAARVWLS